MAYTTYHSLTGPQGRAYRGYQGTRYESALAPRSTFETRGSMPMAAQPADEVAQKEVAEKPSPVDAIRQLATEGRGQEQTPEQGSYTPQSPFAEAMQREAFGDYGLTGLGVNAGLNTALAVNAGAPTGAAIRHGVASTVAAPAAALGIFGDLATSGVAADQVTKSQYGDILGGYTDADIAEQTNLRDIDESAVDAGVSFTPAPENADMFNAYEDARKEVSKRSSSLTPSISFSGVDPGQIGRKMAGMVTGTPTQTVFDDVVLPERYQKLLGQPATGGVGGDGGRSQFGDAPTIGRDFVRGPEETRQPDVLSPDFMESSTATMNALLGGKPQYGMQRGGGNGPGRGDSMGGGRAASDAGMSGQNDAGGLGGFGMW